MKVIKAESTLCEVRDNIQSRVGGAGAVQILHCQVITFILLSGSNC